MSSAIDFSWKIKLCFRRNTVKIKLWCNTVYWKTVAFSPLGGNHMVASVAVWHHMSPPQRSFDTIFHRCFIILPSSSWKSLSSYIIFLSLTAFKNYDMLTPIHQILATIQNFGHKKARSLVCRKATNPDQKIRGSSCAVGVFPTGWVCNILRLMESALKALSWTCWHNCDTKCHPSFVSKRRKGANNPISRPSRLWLKVSEWQRALSDREHVGKP